MIRKLLFASFTLAATLAMAPSASADDFTYAIVSWNDWADLTVTASPVAGQPGDCAITGYTGEFTDPDSGPVIQSLTNPATTIWENAAAASGHAENGRSESDNLLDANRAGNGDTRWNDSNPVVSYDPGDTLPASGPRMRDPEPDSLLLFGTGLLSLSLLISRQLKPAGARSNF